MYGPTDTDNDGRYPDGCPVLTPFPVTDQEIAGGRGAWPWLPATVVAQCGPDEWSVCIEDERAAADDDGTPCYPVVFRDSAEIRLPDPAVEDMRAIFFPGDGGAP